MLTIEPGIAKERKQSSQNLLRYHNFLSYDRIELSQKRGHEVRLGVLQIGAAKVAVLAIPLLLTPSLGEFHSFS
jgi:hypothetical protein